MVTENPDKKAQKEGSPARGIDWWMEGFDFFFSLVFSLIDFFLFED